MAFSNIRQKADQSLQDYAKECSVLGRAAHRFDPDDVLQQRLVKAFVSGLRQPQFKIQLSCQVHPTLDAALQAALQAESWNPQEPSRKVRVTTLDSTPAASAPPPAPTVSSTLPTPADKPKDDYMTILQTLTKKVDNLLQTPPPSHSTRSNSRAQYHPYNKAGF